MTPLRLRLRTPSGLVVDTDVEAVTAEDRSGWFGVRPGRTDLIAVLPPGLLVFVDDQGEEGFVALSGGLLDLKDGECRVLTGDATLSRDLDAIADDLRAQRQSRTDHAATHRGVMRDLAREALRRLLRGRR